MEIPKEFKIMGETITVKFKDDLKVRRDNFGETHHRFNEIWIDSTLSDDIKQHTFWHEFVHIALEKMLEHELSDNEKFVNILGGFINQAMNTMLYFGHGYSSGIQQINTMGNCKK